MPTPKCKVMLCYEEAAGLVRMAININGHSQIRTIPMCEPCSNSVKYLIEMGRAPALTPDGNVYADDLWELLRPRA